MMEGFFKMKLSIKLLTATILVISVVFTFARYEAKDSSLKDSSITQYTKINYDRSTSIAYWQSYEGSPYRGIHEYLDGDFSFQIEKIKKPSSDFHTGYAFIHKGELIFEDRANSYQYVLGPFGSFKKVEKELADRGVYRSRAYQFHFNRHNGKISACLILNNKICSGIEIHSGTFPYVYAVKNNSVLSISNWGDALLFRDGVWCRMQMNNDIWSCKKPQPDMLNQPRKIQFYSSVLYLGRVLLGEWPTGRIYEFDGSTLKPSDMTPPFIEAQALNRLGYEAQSMAEYCGDLFIGYWPKGEVWRWDQLNKKWSLFHRFFTDSPDEAFIPHSNRKSDNLSSSFFGQRVTSLIPFDNALYVATSNLNAWSSTAKAEKIIGKSLADEYGAIYKITRYGCKSTYFKLE